jgi:phosphate transport system permease protein
MPASPTPRSEIRAVPRRRGRSFVWLCGGALAFNLLVVGAIVGLVASHGLAYFWPRELVQFDLKDGRKLLGEVNDREEFRPPDLPDGAPLPWRTQLNVGNRDLGGLDFVWVDEREVVATSRPPDALRLERVEWGVFHGFLRELRHGGAAVASGPEAWPRLLATIEEKRADRDELARIEKGELADVNLELERLRLAHRRVELDAPPADEAARRVAELDARRRELDARFAAIGERTQAVHARLDADVALVATAHGETKEVSVGAIVRALEPDRMGTLAKLRLFGRRLVEFVVDDPRELNTEGGVFPALFGTMLMVFLMSVAVVPLGVLAALYLREYAKQGALVRVVRIAVNNLAGVPSIVFGIFGLGFFVYGVGGSIDRLFFAAALPQPTFGTGGILWAACTLALLTVPVVIVATEEGLAAVPRAVREGSMALGATKFETTWRVVLPAAAPGMLTGVILATARAAGEVAPLMIVGMVKLAPALPLDRHFPFVHLDRKFMHLGFHLFDVGFQSPNVEATQPLVFATALLLLLLVVAMNLVAITVRNRLRRRYATSAL